MHSLNINKKISKIMAAMIIAGSLTAFAGNNTVSADEISDIAVVSETTETRAEAKNGFVKEGNKTFYYKNGNKVKGWVEANGEKYYFMNSFEMAQSRYRTIGGVDYYFKADGTLAANEVVKTTDGIFRFDANGKKVENEKYAEVVDCDFLTIRAASNAKAEEKGKLNPGTLIKITGEANGWNRIETLDGEKGWVSSDYLNYNIPVNEKVQKVISVAKAQMGKPYRWGATGPNSFDCSGLMQYAFKNGAGISLPRVSRDQANVGKKVSKAELQPGDLVFFAKGGRIHHVGMYLGNDQYIHAPQTGDVVKISKLSARKMIVARRVV